MLNSRVSSRPETGRGYRSTRGSTLAAALALALLVFAIAAAATARVACTYARISLRHNQTVALFAAEAGLRKAARELLADRTYSGELGTRLPTGRFDVEVTPADGGFIVTSTGTADSPFGKKPHKTVRARITIEGTSFRIGEWREDP